MAGVFIRREEEAQKPRHTGIISMWWRWQRLEWCVYRPRNTKDFWQPQKLRKSHGTYSTLKPLERECACQNLDWGLLLFRTLKWWISVSLKPPSLLYFAMANLENWYTRQLRVPVQAIQETVSGTCYSLKSWDWIHVQCHFQHIPLDILVTEFPFIFNEKGQTQPLHGRSINKSANIFKQPYHLCLLNLHFCSYLCVSWYP